ncbi:MAG: lytic transglycosylase domain-containing protein [Sphingomicrobium sp.]
MSSMWRIAYLVPIALAGTAAVAMQYQLARPTTAPAFTNDVGYALNDWRRLRTSSGYAFADYARFLIANPGWPDESKLRRWAESQMRPGNDPATVIAFFATDKPGSGNGWARLADAYAASGRAGDALDAARKAWGSSDLNAADEQSLWARYGGSFTAADHDQRTDSLLFDKRVSDAARFIALTSPQRRAAFAARVAMQSGAPDAEAQYGAVIGWVTSDAGLMMDRARFLRAGNHGDSARALFARSHQFMYRPADVDRFYEMTLLLAEEAQSERQYQTAYNIARQVDDSLPPGTVISAQPYGVRDKYTSITWLGGRVAFDRLDNRPGAAALFARYGSGGQSLQVLTKGEYWAGRASSGAGANAHFARAAAYPELFYGQLSLERLGRVVPAPGITAAQYAAPTQRAAFNSRRLVQVLRILGQQQRSAEQALFVQALAKSLNNDPDRALAVELGQQLGRQDLPVWVARMARNSGSMFYVRQGYPSLASNGSASWALVHGITRQESSFDPYAMSPAGALGMMQLMRGTAREQADKSGVGYDPNRLLSDPNYNVLLGSAYFQRMLNNWNGSVPLAVASYNAGSGNVRKWIRAYGDPRGNVDMIRWIEAIPFTETRGYVQRVIENSVVYDSISRPQGQSAIHVSRYLGKSSPG